MKIKNFLPIFEYLSKTNKRRLVFLSVAMAFGSLVEVFSIGSIIPFLAILSNRDGLTSSGVSIKYLPHLFLDNSNLILLFSCLVFGALSILSGLFKIYISWLNNKVAFSIGSELSVEIYNRTLHQPYITHISRNSSEIIAGITSKANGVIYTAVLPVLTMFNSLLLLIAIILGLVYIEPTLTIFAILIFSSFYLLVIRITRKILRADSEVISYESINVQKLLQEGLGGIRDVLINNSQSFFCDLYKKSDASLRNAQARASFIGSTPKFILESLGMFSISLTAYFFSNAEGGNIISTIPLLGAFALGAQKMLPAAQQIYGSWVYIQSGTNSLNDVLVLLNQKIPLLDSDIQSEKLSFERSIILSKIFFRYGDCQKWVISDLSISIAKGERVGIIGPTGCGKSTLLDILMGLLIPASGSIAIDGCTITVSNLNAWRGLIAHVPQYIYLSDASIAENIAFGFASDAIDMNAVVRAAKLAQIHEVVEGLPKKYQSLVGERGVKLSGGQRQRIGLARALYRDSQVIIFDEATSALDDITEAAVMDSVMQLDRDITVVIVAHRTSTLRECDSIIKFEDGGVRKISPKERLALR